MRGWATVRGGAKGYPEGPLVLGLYSRGCGGLVLEGDEGHAQRFAVDLLLLLLVLLLQLDLSPGVEADRLLLHHNTSKRHEPAKTGTCLLTLDPAPPPAAENLGGRLHHLLTAGDGAAAEVSAGFGIDHGGDVLLGHQVGKELLAALHLLPEDRRRCR